MPERRALWAAVVIGIACMVLMASAVAYLHPWPAKRSNSPLSTTPFTKSPLSTASLACQNVIASEAEPPAYQSVVFNQVALPLNALQVNSSGEPDSTARLFAKAGLDVASGASFELIVPAGWVGHLTIGWGSPAKRTNHLYVSGCEATGSQKPWLVFAGGFWVGEPACVPLLVRAGDREQLVQIGVGAACPGQAAPPPGT